MSPLRPSLSLSPCRSFGSGPGSLWGPRGRPLNPRGGHEGTGLSVLHGLCVGEGKSRRRGVEGGRRSLGGRPLSVHTLIARHLLKVLCSFCCVCCVVFRVTRGELDRCLVCLERNCLRTRRFLRLPSSAVDVFCCERAVANEGAVCSIKSCFFP